MWDNAVTAICREFFPLAHYSNMSGEILCKTEKMANDIADRIDDLLGITDCHTHYYDPAEDTLEGCVDNLTGYWAVYID